MELATCSYQEMRAEWGVAVAISTKLPTYLFAYPWVHYPRLAPRNLTIPPHDPEFERRYWEQLDDQTLEGITTDLKQLQASFAKSPEERVVLLCHEQREAERTCHRRSFARWWDARTGQFVPELGSS